MSKYQLDKKELSEPLMMTWGRISTIAEDLFINPNKDKCKRLKALTDKFNDDLKKAKIQEKFFE